MGRLDDKVALITGAARSQGAEIARMFVAEGAKVIVTDILDDLGQAVTSRLGKCAAWCHLDVSKSREWIRAVELAVTRFGALNVLINNAGIFPKSPMLEMPEEQFMQVIMVNQLGVWLGMRTVADAMCKAGGGSIVNTSAICGIVGMAGLSAYVGTKHAVRGLSKTAALELGVLGIRVNTILPGPVAGDFVGFGKDPELLQAKFAHQPVPRIGTPADIAKLMVFLASDESSYITGAEIVIDGGGLAGVPALPAGRAPN